MTVNLCPATTLLPSHDTPPIQIPAQTIKHEPKTLDVQQSLNDSAMLINVTGDMAIDGGNPLKFTQTFQLVATGPGAFYVHNDMFRLNYC